MRLTELTLGADINTYNARFFASSVLMVAHIISATVTCPFGAQQFGAQPRRGRLGQQRLAGHIVLAAGGDHRALRDVDGSYLRAPLVRYGGAMSTRHSQGDLPRFPVPVAVTN